MSRLFRNVIKMGGLETEKGVSKSIKVRAERHIDLILSQSSSQQEVFEKLEQLEKDFVKLAETIVNRWDGKHGKTLNSALIRKALEYFCCVLEMDFQFLCSTIKCD